MIRGDRLRELRERAGLSQSELAQKLRMSEPQLWRYEHNTAEPRVNVVSRLANFFNVSTDYLLGHSDLPTPTFDDTSLSEKELAVVAALRQGERLKAIGLIVADQLAI